MTKKVLIAGESWMTYTTHVKGFDTFYTSEYAEGIEFIRAAIEKAGYLVDYIPNHLAPDTFPITSEELNKCYPIRYRFKYTSITPCYLYKGT